MQVVFATDNLGVERAEPTLVFFARQLMERPHLVGEEQGGRVQVHLDVVEAEDFFDCRVLELDIVVHIVLRLLRLLDGLLDHFNGRLLLVRDLAHGFLFLHFDILLALLEHEQAIWLLLEHL